MQEDGRKLGKGSTWRPRGFLCWNSKKKTCKLHKGLNFLCNYYLSSHVSVRAKPFFQQTFPVFPTMPHCPPAVLSVWWPRGPSITWLNNALTVNDLPPLRQWKYIFQLCRYSLLILSFRFLYQHNTIRKIFIAKDCIYAHIKMACWNGNIFTVGYNHCYTVCPTRRH